MGPIKKKEKKDKKKSKGRENRLREERRIVFFFLIFFLSPLFLRFTEIELFEFVMLRTKSALRDEGYAWVPKTRDFAEKSGKSSENPIF